MPKDLTSSQQAALEQLQQITAAEDPEHDLAVLESVGWNVEKAAQAIFDNDESISTTGQVDPSTSTSNPRTIESFDIDDSSQGQHGNDSTFLANRLPAPRGSAAPAYPHQSSWLSILSFPITFVGGLLGLVLRILRVPFVSLSPFFFRASSGTTLLRPGFGFGGRSITEDPIKTAEHFVRDLEDETGALTISHRSEEKAGDDGAASSSRHSTAPLKTLPDFFIGSYDQALKEAESDLKVLCVIIQSSEHDDVLEFRRTVLTDSDFVKTLTNNDFLVWGGDIRERDAYIASHKLGATTYPFVAFVALHPTPSYLGGSGQSGRGSGPRMTVLSRHEGSPTTVTSAQTLTTHITTSLLPRVTPLLSRLRTERWERAQERALREQQDRAFDEAARRDREKVEKRQAEERALAEASRRKEEERRRVESKRSNLAAWRRYVRKALIPPEPPSSPHSGSRSPSRSGLRVGIRLPDGKRVIRRFATNDSASALYAYVESLFIPSSDDPANDPADPPPGYGEHDWTFQLVTSFPRKEIPAGWDVELGSLEELKGGANLALEMKREFSTTKDDDDESGNESD